MGFKTGSSKASENSKPQLQVELGTERRRVTVRQFKGKSLIDIREYYEKDDEWLPGKKGISLTVAQWEALVASFDSINAALEELDEPEPKPKTENKHSRKRSDDSDDDSESKRAHIE